MSIHKVFCFGEILLHYAPPSGTNYMGSHQMPFYLGGAELNVATALANWEVPVKYATAMPAHFLTNNILGYLNQKNIDTSAIQFSGNRIGCFYLAEGLDMKSAGVVYDRDNSSFAEIKKGSINWKEVLKDVTWFHFSAISASLTQNATDVCEEALVAATELGIPISVDLNYRAKLWQYGKKPIEVMSHLVKYCTLLMGNLWAVEEMLAIQSSIQSSEGFSKADLEQAAHKSMTTLKEQYPLLNSIAYTFRLTEKYFGIMYNKNNFYTSPTYNMNEVKNIVGTGDCFMAGLIYGICNHHTPEELINFAAAAAVGKLYELGDATDQTVEQIKNRML
jgi:2-dehydro-3-deoxygluconokinase